MVECGTQRLYLAMMVARLEARAEKRWTDADSLRDLMVSHGWALQDLRGDWTEFSGGAGDPIYSLCVREYGEDEAREMFTDHWSVERDLLHGRYLGWWAGLYHGIDRIEAIVEGEATIARKAFYCNWNEETKAKFRPLHQDGWSYTVIQLTDSEPELQLARPTMFVEDIHALKPGGADG